MEAGWLCESCTINIACQRGPLGIQAVIWACLTASNHEIHQILSCDETCSRAGLRAQHFDEHAFHTGSCLIPNECYSSPPSRSDGWIRSTSHLKTSLAMNMFAPLGGLFIPVRIITLRAELLKWKQGSSAIHVLATLRVSADPWASRRSFGLV